MKRDGLVWVVVMSKPKIAEVDICTLTSVQATLEHIARIGLGEDPREIERIFAVSVYGSVTQYRVIFDGKLKLEAVPNVPSGQRD